MMDSVLPLLPSSGMMVLSAGWLLAGGRSFHTAARRGLEANEDMPMSKILENRYWDRGDKKERKGEAV
jgi:hypothetical protein